MKSAGNRGLRVMGVAGLIACAACVAARGQDAASGQIRSYGSESHIAEEFVIDDFEGSEVDNRLGSRANIYVQFPSRIMVSRTTTTRPAATDSYHVPVRVQRPEGVQSAADDAPPCVMELREIWETNGDPATSVLILKFEKANEGGPYGEGGWCGYYTLLKQMRNNEEDVYFDASPFNAIAFRVKGEKGGESFAIGLSDRHWDKVGDSLKSESIGTYLPEGGVTTNWQEAVIPLDVFFLDRAKLSAITVSFEASCFADGKGEGTIYIDNIALRK